MLESCKNNISLYDCSPILFLECTVYGRESTTRYKHNKNTNNEHEPKVHEPEQTDGGNFTKSAGIGIKVNAGFSHTGGKQAEEVKRTNEESNMPNK